MFWNDSTGDARERSQKGLNPAGPQAELDTPDVHYSAIKPVSGKEVFGVLGQVFVWTIKNSLLKCNAFSQIEKDACR